ncbi:MAG: response regulator [Pseudodesulfovibrio sp.]|uniref:histidine kinase n=1 Tax=Pseudodesulfovibrio aespoeensis (strain ATCC 700646 / DSM 10631 / Aspo-2) TaxID=643562 RepID=E6VW71_PSEA9|nr:MULTISPECIES: hybrid sensor histidine kinase/response regulator [Pseudodesulfovibrio]MBU4378653.1 response regulator [Pseudomonadota bacterium]ADU63631.1 response regulator receiver [Pseudodesulfovibrio aespoeensis Aspo-2]MBU4475518.1 response regulator [Pseudomonadota bacterium]MBU4515374.1 response regulator [Pseudomonadota bacterium]MBU4522268.1 response regulator [Pseudomonadota bacterium]
MQHTVLLVDDEEGIRTVLSLAIADAGYEVLTAQTGAQALEMLGKREIPLIVTDIRMPGMDGLELLKRIRKEWPDSEVIMITGHGDMDVAIESLRLGAGDFITKPLHENALEISLKRAVEKISIRDQLREYTENLEHLVLEKSKELVEAERMAAVGQTVASMSHAIKNVAGGLEGGMFVIEKGLELENREYLRQGWEMVRRDVERIKNLSMELLDYAKPVTITPVDADPNGPARQVHDLMAKQAENCGVRLVLDLDESLPSMRIDPNAIHQCLTNLVSNAIDACQDRLEGEKKVVIRTLDGGGMAVRYEVADTGHGIAPEILTRIFNSFFTTKGSRGTGIGLMATKKLVKEMGGAIMANSGIGQGATFTITIPTAHVTT